MYDKPIMVWVGVAYLFFVTLFLTQTIPLSALIAVTSLFVIGLAVFQLRRMLRD